MNRFLAVALALACLSLALPARSEEMTEQQVKELLARPMSQLKTWGFDPDSAVESRIGPAPAFLNAAMIEYDGKDDYKPYTPTAEEKILIEKYLVRLPRSMREAFKERLIGIYFIENFTGNGMTSWVVGEQNKLYAWMVFNPIGFRRTISETLTLRDTSVFKGKAPVKIDAGAKYKGILYTLVHEGTHAYDYVRGLTPFVESAMVYVTGGTTADVSWDVWERIGRPAKGIALSSRDKIKFYGMGGGPLAEGKDAAKIYSELVASPFASLYSTQSWAEDVAELVTFYHLTETLKQPYVIKVTAGKGRSFEPMKKGAARDRAERIYKKLL